MDAIPPEGLGRRASGRRVVWGLAAVALAASLLAASPASANGRYPRAERLLEDPADPQRLLLSATYGLLETPDRGKNWYHVCEAAFAQPGYDGDPLIDLASGSTLLADVQSAIVRSPDGCTFDQALGQRSDGTTTVWVDFAVERSRGAIVVAVANRSFGGTSVIALEESTDAGLTWASIGQPLPLSDVFTVDLAPGDPTHIYASGQAPAGDGGAAAQGVLVESTDHGRTWTTHPIPGAGTYAAPYIAAVDPKNPRALFVRTDAIDLAPDAEGAPDDALLYSPDAGATWRELIRKHAKLLGFALSPDGSAVLAGYGNPDASPTIDPSQLGIFEASTLDWKFSSVYGGESITCLTWTAAGTYVCTALGASRSFEQLAFIPAGALGSATAPVSLMQFGDVRGPPPCCNAIDALCAWSSNCGLFDACDDASDAPPVCDGGPLDEAAAPEGSNDAARARPEGSMADAATQSEPPDAPSMDADGAETAPPSDRGPMAGVDGGRAARCTCEVARGARDASPAAGRLGITVLGVPALGIVVRRRRRATRS